jgi:DNA-binding transcriptional LysR family regulator
MLFDLRALGYFVAAYEERSVTTAARRCFVAQPSISMAIKGLEDALDTVLFERSRQGLAPTPAAHRLYPRACSLLAQSSAMVRDFRDAPRETLGVFLQDDLMVGPAAPLFAQIADLLPNTLVRLTATAQEARLRLVAEHCKPPGDTFVSLWREPYVMPLLEWPYCPLHQSFIRLLAERGIALEVQASAAREELLLHMVDSGLGVAVVPQSHAAHARRSVTRPLDGPLAFSRHLGLACDASDAPMLALLGRLADSLKASVIPQSSVA